jgi:hypothetical protein
VHSIVPLLSCSNVFITVPLPFNSNVHSIVPLLSCSNEQYCGH